MNPPHRRRRIPCDGRDTGGVSRGPHDLTTTISGGLTVPAEQIRRLSSTVEKQDEVDALHDLRVAVRTTRALLRLYRPVMKSGPTSRLDAEMRWVARTLGDVRELDVVAEVVVSNLAVLGKRHYGLWAMSRLLDERHRARRRLVVVLGSDRYRDARCALDEMTSAPPIRRSVRQVDPREEVVRLAAVQWSRLVDAVNELGAVPEDDALHRARLLAKRARYAADAVASTTDASARQLAIRLSRVQDVLGSHQDAVAARNWLDVMARDSADVDEAFVLGEVAGLLRAEQQRLRGEWPEVWRAAARPKLRRWMAP